MACAVQHGVRAARDPAEWPVPVSCCQQVFHRLVTVAQSASSGAGRGGVGTGLREFIGRVRKCPGWLGLLLGSLAETGRRREGYKCNGGIPTSECRRWRGVDLYAPITVRR